MIPTPPKQEEPALNQDEIGFILRTTLTPSHHEDPIVLKFISSYLNNRDIRQASIDAGIDQRSARNLRSRPDIHLAITKITEQAVMKYGFDADEIVQRAKEMAEVDPADFVDAETGAAIMNLHDVPLAARRALKSFKVKNLYEDDPNGMPRLIGHLVEYSFWDKPKSVEMLGREKGKFKETKVVEHDVSKGMKSLLLGSLERAEQRVIEARQAIDVTPVLEGQVANIDDKEG